VCVTYCDEETEQGVTVTTILAAAVEGAHAESSIPPVAVGLVAFAGLMALLFITYAFRSVGTRHQGD